MDHVGGIGNVSIGREIAAGEFMSDAGEMVFVLEDKFGWRTDPTYVIKEIDENRLEVTRAESALGRQNFKPSASSRIVLALKLPHTFAHVYHA